MGAYLSEPNLNKESLDSENGLIAFGASSMQGWRLDQEDAHNAILDFDPETKTSFFAVYDGHGGAEVAVYCSKYLPEMLKSLPEYKSGDLVEALKTVFLKFDESLLSEQAQKELRELRDLTSKKTSICREDGEKEEEEEEVTKKKSDAKKKEPREGEEDAEDDGEETKVKYANEADQLYDEATMPIEEVLKRYSKAENKMKKILKESVAGSGSAVKFGLSPMLSAAGSSKLKRGSEKDVTSTTSTTATAAAAAPLHPSSTADFQKQEEIDISEIKKNSANPADDQHLSTQDIDEASNLCDMTDSQKSILANESATQLPCTSTSTDLTKAQNTASEPASAEAAAVSAPISAIPAALKVDTAQQVVTPSKTKLNKEELKLSPIRKKSASSSSLLDDDLTPVVNTSGATDTLNGANGSMNNEENKENDICNSSNHELTNGSAAQKDQKDDLVAAEATAVPAPVAETGATNGASNGEAAATEPAAKSPTSVNNNSSSNGGKTTLRNGKSTSLSKNTLMAKIIAGCVNEKLKQLKNEKKPTNGTKGRAEANGGDDEEDDEDYEGEDDEDEEDDDDYEGEDSTEEEEDDDDDDDDDDDSEDDEDYEEEEDEEEEEVEEGEGLDVNPDGYARPGHDSGCTAVVAVLRDTKLYVANAGDSRCVVCRDGKAIEMSFDHKPEDECERKRIENAGGQVTRDGRVNNGLNLSRAIGDHSYKVNKSLPLSEQMITSLPDLKSLDIDRSKDKFMVLACDGIWNFMSSQEVCDYVQERLDANYAKLSLICEELFMHCLAPNTEGDGTGCDNMTCIIITFNPFRKIELKFTTDPTLVAEDQKNCLKRALDDKSQPAEKEELMLAAAKKMKPDSSMLKDEENVTTTVK